MGKISLWREGINMTLGDVLDHRELYLAYPELRETPVRLVATNALGDGKLAALLANGSIEIAAGGPPQELRGELLAVVQPLVNQIEVFGDATDLD